MVSRLLVFLSVLLLAGCDYTIAHYNPDSSPTTWECHTVTWRINPAGFTAAQVETFKEAFRAAHAASGVPTQYLGTTTGRPANANEGPVIVFRTDLPGSTAAITELHYNGQRYDGGYIKVDYNLPSYFFDDMAWHEVGHAYGLGHPAVSGQVMSTTSAGPPYRSGDLAGLAAVGC